ncbi:hypothetical protein IB238_23490 [Rhizobium sp. ARZ01]|uniref:hypothetical protein n=1 Tax=Rhizobium sp. ARZ01 TaxID=2769313 RepID=UPI00177FDA7F|nr:hypothetical protein [Rhizobium sp. ARZ01]MBD9375577.1 hypothetical protein [Rhizobium sp. ARZ01]
MEITTIVRHRPRAEYVFRIVAGTVACWLYGTSKTKRRGPHADSLEVPGERAQNLPLQGCDVESIAENFLQSAVPLAAPHVHVVD